MYFSHEELDVRLNVEGDPSVGAAELSIVRYAVPETKPGEVLV